MANSLVALADARGLDPSVYRLVSHVTGNDSRILGTDPAKALKTLAFAGSVPASASPRTGFARSASGWF